MQVRKEAFEEFKLPFTIVFGKIGKLNVTAPWRSLSSSPVEAILESLYLVVVPKKREDWTIIDFNSYEKKISKLEAFSTQLAAKLREEGTP